VTSETRALPAHGTKPRATRISGHRKNCNCPGCYQRVNRYKKHRLVAQNRGTWQPLSDAAPHLAVLAGYRAAAWTPVQIGAVTGLDYKLVRILLGEDASVAAPVKLRAGTVTALRRLRGADRLDATVPDVTIIDATGSRRMVQALGAIGWPQKSLAGRTGPLNDIAHVRNVTAGTARRIAAVYAELSDAPGPSRSAAIRARGKGWATPAGWEDLDVFDPATVPHDLTARDRTPEELVEDAEYIRETDNATWQHVAERLRVDVDTLHTYRSRVRERAAASAGDAT
jgi:hypothetical protein